jgi:hypothetical protein
MGVWTRKARYAHSITEPLLDDVDVESVQVTTTEAFDLDARGWFYDRMLQVLGTLLPILRDNDMLGAQFGRYVLAADAGSGTCDGRRRRGGAARQALQRR